MVKEIRRSDGTHSDVLWQAAANGVSGRTIDEYGRALAAKLGNGIDLAWERPTAGGGVRTIQAAFAGTVVRRFEYAYDGFQNLRTRTDKLVDASNVAQTQGETFAYDALQRLTSWTITGLAACRTEKSALPSVGPGFSRLWT